MKNNNSFDNILNLGKGKINSEGIKKAKNGDIDGFLNSIPKADAEKLNNILKDKTKMQEILSSESAKKLLELLGGNK